MNHAAIPKPIIQAGRTKAHPLIQILKIMEFHVSEKHVQRESRKAVYLILFFAAVSAGLFISVAAVGGESLTLSPSELKVIYNAAGLTEQGGQFLDDCDQPVQPDTNVFDLNGDGQSEIFVQVGGSCYGAAGAKLTILIKDKLGRWQSNFGFPVGGYKLLSTKNKGYPDIEIGGPSFCLPVWRWNGNHYAINKRCDR